MGNKAMVPLFSSVLLLLLSLLLPSSSLAKLEVINQPTTKPDGSLSLLVIGDWGRKGLYNQSKVAEQMGVIGNKLNISFVISTGDNFYEEGLEGVKDTAFKDSFSRVYKQSSLQKTWFAVLGNHDYKGDVLAQLSEELRKQDKRWVCKRSYVVDAGIAGFFFVDTTPMVDEYWSNDEYIDKRGVLPRDKYVDNLLRDLNDSLINSKAPWKFVVGHQTMAAAGYQGDTEELLQKLLPILQVNKVDAYVNGHDHCLEHITSSDNSMHYLTSGGGSMAWSGIYRQETKNVKFFYDGEGFMSMELTALCARIAFYNIDGDVLHEFYFPIKKKL